MNIPGINIIFFMSLVNVAMIPKDRPISSARVAVHYCSQKADMNAMGGNLITYPGELTTTAVDLVTQKVCVLSKPHAKYITADTFFCLNTTLDGFKYIHIPFNLIHEQFLHQCNL